MSEFPILRTGGGAKDPFQKGREGTNKGEAGYFESGSGRCHAKRTK